MSEPHCQFDRRMGRNTDKVTQRQCEPDVQSVISEVRHDIILQAIGSDISDGSLTVICADPDLLQGALSFRSVKESVPKVCVRTWFLAWLLYFFPIFCDLREGHMVKSIVDARSQQARTAVWEAKKTFSFKDILSIAGAAGHPNELSESGLRKFAMTPEQNLSAQYLDPLFSFLFETPVGRLLRKPSAELAGEYDQITRILAGGKRGQPSGLDISGRYFAYHGSHLWKDRYVVRAVTISHTFDGISVYRDFLRDKGQCHEAIGLVSFHLEMPQIVIFGKDNAIGFRLIVGDEALSGSVNITGQMFGMTRNIRYFSRAILLRKVGQLSDEKLSETAGTARDEVLSDHREKYKAMISDTGIYRLTEIPKSHRSAFDDLAKTRPQQDFEDPILKLSRKKRSESSRPSPKATAKPARKSRAKSARA
jgi:hypothetical protein